MSIEARDWAKTITGLSATQKSVLKEIADRFNEGEGLAWPSTGRIAKDTGLDRSTVVRALRVLEGKKLIIRIRRTDVDTGGYLSNQYLLPQYRPVADVQPTSVKVQRWFDFDGTRVQEIEDRNYPEQISSPPQESHLGDLYASLVKHIDDVA